MALLYTHAVCCVESQYVLLHKVDEVYAEYPVLELSSIIPDDKYPPHWTQ
jgi:hypothetical protein